MSTPTQPPTGQPQGPESLTPQPTGGWPAYPPQQPYPGTPPYQQVPPTETPYPGQGYPVQGFPGQPAPPQGYPAGVRSGQPVTPTQPFPSTVATPAGIPVMPYGGQVEIAERPAWHIQGLLGVLVGLLALIVGILLVASPDLPQILGVVFILIGVVVLTGVTVISPGDTRVVQFFGRYIGTLRQPGLLMTVPLTSRRAVSVRVRNFETNELKVNDADGNPINIAAIVVWQVADTAKSVFAVEDYRQFVAVQSESALRHIASSHPYDNAGPGEETLRGSTERVAEELAREVATRIAIAGLQVVETRISSLSYAPEIAQAMLQRQQASAVIAAREKIVEGAVSMVENALHKIDDEGIVTMDEQRKAAMVSNLLVVLCSDSRATPVLNTGTGSY